MKRLDFTVEHDLGRIQQELFEGVPALAPVPRDDGRMEAVAIVSGDGETLTLYVPDEITPDDEAAIEQFVKRHKPAPLPEPLSRDERLRETIEAGKAAISGATTLAQIKAVFAATLDGLGDAITGDNRS